jgi:hypothetical protein
MQRHKGFRFAQLRPQNQNAAENSVPKPASTIEPHAEPDAATPPDAEPPRNDEPDRQH